MCWLILIIAAVRHVNMERMFIFVFTPLLGVILLRWGWLAWKEIKKSQR